MIDTNTITGCEVCHGKNLVSVLDLGRHPMCDDLVACGDARVCQEFPIEIVYCSGCHTAHQRYQIPKAALFPKTYHYRSRFTADVLDGMRALVDDTLTQVRPAGAAVVLDIGCNDGSLLDFFAAKGCRTIGVEPTGASDDAAAKGHRVYAEFFTRALAKRIASENPHIDIVTFTNVFAHIEDLGSVLEALTEVCGANTTVVIENHYLGAIVERHQFDTFYHEHPRSYSLSSFMRIAARLGMRLQHCAFPSRYGGNIRVMMSRSAGSAIDAEREIAAKGEAGFQQRLSGMASAIGRWRTRKSQELAGLVRQHGPLPAKAFPGRAAILVKMLGLGVESIARVHEKPGSIKIGHYVPGTRIPIVSDDDLPTGAGSPPVLLNLAWHISTEIRSYLTRRGHAGQVIDILAADDLAP